MQSKSKPLTPAQQELAIEQGRKLIQDTNRQITADFAKRCQQGDKDSCQFLLDEREEKEHEAVTRKYKYIACNMGIKDACTWLESEKFVAKFVGE